MSNPGTNDCARKERGVVILKDDHKHYFVGSTTVEAVRGVSITVQPPEVVAVCGPSGSGKSTLLNLIGCLDLPTKGDVIVCGKRQSGLDDNERSDLRIQEIGFVFQTFNLIPVLTAFENVEYPLVLRSTPRRKRVELVSNILAAVGLEGYMDRYPRQLSGGQQQRVAIARAMVSRPRLILGDEPTANLDTAIGTQVLELLLRLCVEQDGTLIFSTHDSRLLGYANRIITMTDGCIHHDEGHN